ncbi:MAG: hypothetical protein OEV04_16930 [Nitrospira sp.]|nr:hypothetical protein [Nitrospira sp.]
MKLETVGRYASCRASRRSGLHEQRIVVAAASLHAVAHRQAVAVEAVNNVG